jgi:hypothetical protein
MCTILIESITNHKIEINAKKVLFELQLQDLYRTRTVQTVHCLLLYCKGVRYVSRMLVCRVFIKFIIVIKRVQLLTYETPVPVCRPALPGLGYTVDQ